MTICECVAKINEDHPRREMWVRSLGPDPSLPIMGPETYLGEFGKRYLRFDLTRLDWTKINDLIRARASEFNLTRQESMDAFSDLGFIPILAEHTTLKMCPLHGRERVMLSRSKW